MPSTVRVLAIGNVYPPHHLGGYEIIWQGVMRHLRRQGHEARVLVSDFAQPGVPADALEDPEIHRELEWYWHDHAWRRLNLRERLALERRNAERLRRHLHELQPEVIAWWPVGGLSLSLLEQARQAGIPSVLFVLDPWPSYGQERDLWLRAWRHLGPARALVQRVTGIPATVDWSGLGRWVFCSRTMAGEVAAAGIHVANGTILTPGVERAFLDTPPEPSPPPWRWRLLYLGRVVEQKGVETAVASLAALPEEARLTVVGEGDRDYRARLESRAERLGVAGRVEFRGSCGRDEVMRTLREADAVVFPVQWPEPWGLVPLEAMAARRPVVATGTGGSGDYLVHGENALLFPPGDAGALAGSLRRLAEDPGLRERLRAGGRRTAEKHSEEGFNERALAEILAAATAPRESG